MHTGVNNSKKSSLQDSDHDRMSIKSSKSDVGLVMGSLVPDPTEVSNDIKKKGSMSQNDLTAKKLDTKSGTGKEEAFLRSNSLSTNTCEGANPGMGRRKSSFAEFVWNTTNISESDLHDTLDEDVKHPSHVIGDWGPVQQKIFIVITLIYMIAPFQNLSIVFTAPKMDFTCIVKDPLTGKEISEKNVCFIQLPQPPPILNESRHPELEIPCEEYEYDSKGVFKRTIVDAFDLVCDKSWLPSMTQSLHQVGYAISGILFGIVSDRYGRFFCARIAIILEILAGFGQAFAPNIWIYMVARLVVGIAAYGRYLSGYVLISEWIGPQLRGKMTAIYEYGYTFGNIMFPIVFYAFADYVTIQVGVTIFEIIIFLFYYYQVKESPRWQLTQDKFEDVEVNLYLAAKATGKYKSDGDIHQKIQQLIRNHVASKEQKEEKKLTEDGVKTTSESSNNNKQYSPSILDVWRVPSLLKLCLILYFVWFSEALIGYGKFYNIENIGGNLFLNVLIMSLGGIITNALLFLTIPRFKRKTLMITFISMNCVTLVLTAMCSFHDSLLTPRIVFMLLSTIVGIASYHMVYIYTTESFPTSMRQVSIGTCSIFARVGSCLAPFVKELTNATHLFVSLMSFAVLAFGTIVLLKFVPDTTDIQLPDTITQTQAVTPNRESVFKKDSIISVETKQTV